MLLCLWILLSVGQVMAQSKNDEVDEWADWDYDDVDDQGIFWNTESDDLPSYSSDLDEKDDLDEGLIPVPPTQLPSVIPPTSAPPSPPSSPTPPQTEEIPPETNVESQSPGPENEVIAAASSQEESALLVVVVMTAGTFLAVFAIYTLFSRKGGKKQSQVIAGSKEGSRLLKVPQHGL